MSSINIERFAEKLPKEGDKWRGRRPFGVGRKLYKGKDVFKLTRPITMEVTQTCDEYGAWPVTEYHWDTIEPVLTRWTRFKVWLMGPSLPTAKVVSE